MISIEMRTLIDAMLHECLWDAFIGQPRFDALLQTLNDDDLNALPAFMTERARLAINALPIDNPPDPNRLNFSAYIAERLAVTDTGDDELDALDQELMDELRSGFDEVMPDIMDSNPWD